jgi:hypothetical protein
LIYGVEGGIMQIDMCSNIHMKNVLKPIRLVVSISEIICSSTGGIPMRPLGFHLLWFVALLTLGACTSTTDIDSSTPEVLSMELLNTGPLIRTLNVVLKEKAAITVEYWTDGETPLRMTSDTGSNPSLLLVRLHAGRLYNYRIVGTTKQGTFTTDPLPDDLEAVSLTATGTPTTPLVMVNLSHRDGFKGFVIVDKGGEVVWYWRTRDFPYGMARRSNGNFVFMDKGRGLVEVTPAGREVHELAQDTTGREMHHDVVATPENTLLFIAYDTRQFDGKPLHGDAIWEWNPETGAEAQRWTAWDFFTPTADRGPRFGSEWMHANALAIGPRRNVLMSIHYFNQIISIQPDWKSIEWRLGGINATIPVEGDEQFSGQHTPREIAPGRIVMFDNRTERKDYSRAVEFDIADGTARKVWEWYPTPINFAFAVGAARRTANGNMIVHFGMSPGSVGSTGPIETYEITPGGTPLWHLVVSGTETAYRAEPVESIAGESVL